MSSPLVTVLTAVHNGARYLGETIACIQAQTFTDWEYIIVDDASSDQTVALVEAAMARDSRLRVLRRAVSGGPYTAANDGLRAARGKYVIRIDADDLSPRERIARQVEYLDRHPYRACVSYWQGFNEQGLIPGSVAAVPSSPRVLAWYLLLRSPSLHSAVCYQREMME